MKPKFRTEKANDGFERAVWCIYTDKTGRSVRSYFSAPSPSISHAGFEYIKNRWGIRHWKTAEFIRKEYGRQIGEFLAGEETEE